MAFSLSVYTGYRGVLTHSSPVNELFSSELIAPYRISNGIEVRSGTSDWKHHGLTHQPTVDIIGRRGNEITVNIDRLRSTDRDDVSEVDHGEDA